MCPTSADWKQSAGYYDVFSEAYEDVLDANGIPNAGIVSTREWGTIDRWKDGEGKYRELRGLFGVGHCEVLGWEGFSGACRVHAGEAELWFELLRLRLPRRRSGRCCRGQAE